MHLSDLRHSGNRRESARIGHARTCVEGVRYPPPSWITGTDFLHRVLIRIRYIDYEVQLGEAANARNLYKRLLERTKHVKVWISYAQFEAEAGTLLGGVVNRLHFSLIFY